MSAINKHELAMTDTHGILHVFHPATAHWFSEAFPAPTAAQTQAWAPIADGKNTLLLAPTGSGKTLAAFLFAINRIMFPQGQVSNSDAVSQAKLDSSAKNDDENDCGVQVLYISPLKALGVDVERNLRAPLAGVRAVAQRKGFAFCEPTVGVRSGDTTPQERQRLRRYPPDILITTPESLFLMLTSATRTTLSDVHTVIIDEIHSMVATKRGSHLFLSLERLESLRVSAGHKSPIQRIGLSATQRPLKEVAHLLGGADATSDPDIAPKERHVEIVAAGKSKELDLKVEVPVEDMTKLGEVDFASGAASSGPSPPSIWPAIHPRLVELVRSHRSTMIFVNSRRLAERLATAINDLAEEEISLAHHGSIAKDTRLQIEDRLKRGDLPAIVATSSLELGIDMGAVDLVIQIEAPPSIASGMQRIGRAGHQVNVPSSGVIFPKYRGDLLACSAAVGRMYEGQVEETYFPRNPLDVLAQQLVAMVALEPMSVDEMFALVRRAAPFHELPRVALEGVLDLLSGRYPSDEFSELRPRVTWDRVSNTVSPRKGTQRLAIANAGTIPDRGLYGVFLADGSDRPSRVGELDEEMVFETQPGDVFLLGASSWRVMEITSDRVLVTPAPGEPGRMPFWRGDGPGRPLEFGQAIGELTRELLALPRQKAREILENDHALDRRAAWNLMEYLHDQVAATGEAPCDRTIVFESFLDEIGDWRVAVLTPFGSRVHAPWATAVSAKLENEYPGEVDSNWTDDGMMFRLPQTDNPPIVDWFFPSADEIEDIVTHRLGGTALFAARFRENAARALLLPRRQPGRRTPLWLQRRKSADLLAVAAKYPSFPILLETYRECLRDVFDLRGLKSILADVEQRRIRVREAQTQTPSPFASTLMFAYIGNFLYDGDAPLAERRAASLTLDHAQLRELLGDAELRELLDMESVAMVSSELQRLTVAHRVKHADGIHSLLLSIGDLSQSELAARCERDYVDSGQLDSDLEALASERRTLLIRVGGDQRWIANEDTGRFRDALGIVPPLGVPDAFLETVADPLGDLVSRYARTHGPFTAENVAMRFGLGIAPVIATLERLTNEQRLAEGSFLRDGQGREWCDSQVLRRIKRLSLAKLRKQIEPVEQSALARFLPQWHGVSNRRRGLDGLLDVIEQLQGMPLPVVTLEQHILPARLTDYSPSGLDELCAAGEVVWRGCGGLSAGDGRVALYLADHLALLCPTSEPLDGEMQVRIRDFLRDQGASFFDAIARELGGFRNEVHDALWDLVWAGEVTNDTIGPLRALRRTSKSKSKSRRRQSSHFRSRRSVKTPGTQGRWSLVEHLCARGGSAEQPTSTERQTAVAHQLLQRHGIVIREAVSSEGLPGGFSGIYPVFKAMEEAGRIRRGYFVEALGAAQFASPGAEEHLRRYKQVDPDSPLDYVLAATDPANPYGLVLKWPESSTVTIRPTRSAGARVVICDGYLVGYLSRSGEHLSTFLPDLEPEHSRIARRLVRSIMGTASPGQPVYLTQIDGGPPGESLLAKMLVECGFSAATQGYLYRAENETDVHGRRTDSRRRS